MRFKKLRKYQEGRKSKRSENIPRAQAPRWPHRPVGCRPPEVRASGCPRPWPLSGPPWALRLRRPEDVCAYLSPGVSVSPTPSRPLRPPGLRPAAPGLGALSQGLCPHFLAGTLKPGGQSPREDRGLSCLPPESGASTGRGGGVAGALSEGRMGPLFALLGAMDTGPDPMACGQSWPWNVLLWNVHPSGWALGLSGFPERVWGRETLTGLLKIPGIPSGTSGLCVHVLGTLPSVASLPGLGGS